ncbi:MAG: DUF4124 domain-containing protein, partial [Pseudomonadota bacterium]
MLIKKAMGKWQKLAFSVALLLCIPTVCWADIYTFVDKEGVVHFTNRPRPGRKWKRIMKTGPGKAQEVHAPR